MARLFCNLCNRVTVRLLSDCTDHSDWPPKGSKPKVRIDIIIPTYKPESHPTKAPDPLRISVGQQKRLDRRLYELSLPKIDVDLGETPLNDGKLHCTFCGVPVEQFNLTEGMGPVRKIRDEEIIKENGKIVAIVEKVIHLTDKVIACPDCSLNIHPTYNKKGEQATKGVKFPETEG